MSDRDMNDGVVRVLRLLADRLESFLDGDEDAFETIAESVEQAGLAVEDLQAATLVLRGLYAAESPDASDGAAHAPGADTLRVLSPEERAILAPEAWGYLLWLRSRGSLDAEQCERVLDLVSGSGIRPVGVEHVRDAAVRVAMAEDGMEMMGGESDGAVDRPH